MIGKNFRTIFGKQKEQKGPQNKWRTKPSDNSGNFRSFLEETTWTTCDNSFNVRRPTGRRPSKKRPSNRQLGGATFQSRPNDWSAGGRREGNPRMPLRGLGWLGDGRDVYIENQENRFADRNAWRAREQRRGQTPPGPDGCSEAPAPLPGVRHLAAPWRMHGWKNVSRKVRQVRQVCGRESREGNPQECLECPCTASDGWETGGMSTLKTKKTASRTGTRLGSGWGRQHG